MEGLRCWGRAPSAPPLALSSRSHTLGRKVQGVYLVVRTTLAWGVRNKTVGGGRGAAGARRVVGRLPPSMAGPAKAAGAAPGSLELPLSLSRARAPRTARPFLLHLQPSRCAGGRGAWWMVGGPGAGRRPPAGAGVGGESVEGGVAGGVHTLPPSPLPPHARPSRSPTPRPLRRPTPRPPPMPPPRPAAAGEATAASTADAGDAAEQGRCSTAAAHASALDSSPLECRICLESSSPSSLVHPCSCSGTVAAAHVKCLQTWVEERRGALACEICSAPYTEAVRPLLADAVRRGERRAAAEAAARAAASLAAADAAADDRGTWCLGAGASPSARARAWAAAALVFVVALALLYVVLFVGGDHQPSYWAVLLLRVLAFVLPLYLVCQACLVFRRHRRARVVGGVELGAAGVGGARRGWRWAAAAAPPPPLPPRRPPPV